MGSWWLHWLGWSYLKTYKAMGRRKWHGQVDLKPFLMYTGLHWWFTSRLWMSPLKVPFEIICHTKLCINPLHWTLEKALRKYIQNSLSESWSMHNGTWVSLYILTIESSHMHSNRVRMLIWYTPFRLFLYLSNSGCLLQQQYFLVAGLFLVFLIYLIHL